MQYRAQPDPVLVQPSAAGVSGDVAEPDRRVVGVVVSPQSLSLGADSDPQIVEWTAEAEVYFIVVAETSLGLAMDDIDKFVARDRLIHLERERLRLDLPVISSQLGLTQIVVYCERHPKGWFRGHDLVDLVLGTENLPPVSVVRPPVLQGAQDAGSVRSEWLFGLAVLSVVVVVSLWSKEAMPEHVALVLYVIGIFVVSSRTRHIVSIVVSLLSIVAFETIHDEGFPNFADPASWWVMLSLVVLSLLISTLGWQLREALLDSQEQERRNASFFQLSRELFAAYDEQDVSEQIRKHIRASLGAQTVLFLKDGDEFRNFGDIPIEFENSADDRVALKHCITEGLEVGRSSRAFPAAKGMYVPVKSKEEVLGCLGLYDLEGSRILGGQRFRALTTYTMLAGLSLSRLMNEKANKELERRSAETDTQNILLRSISHDLKTPLTAISGYADHLVQHPEASPEERLEIYQTISQESHRLTTFVNNLLSMTKLESAQLQLNFEPIEPEEIVGAAVSHMRVRLGDHDVATFVEPNLPPLLIDQVLVHQAIVNLLENAVKYTPQGTEIRVEAKREADDIVISVEDSGSGLPARPVEELFEGFKRFHLGRRVEGTGLGLAIVKTIAKIHGGSAFAANRPSRGAKFGIRLPLQREDKR